MNDQRPYSSFASSSMQPTAGPSGQTPSGHGVGQPQSPVGSQVTTHPAGATAANPGSSSGSTSRLTLPAVRTDLPAEQRADEVLRLAHEAFPQTGKWVLFYREILGTDGVARKLFPTADEMREFEQTPQFAEMLEMTAAVRSKDSGKGDELEPQKMITVRLPKSQHEAMKAEAAEHETSINKLCISKLLLPIKAEFIPKEKGKVRGRKPGPQGPNNRLMPNVESQPNG